MTNSDRRILVAIATYNERDSLPVLLQKLRSIIADADVLVVDDNSPDGTGQWLDEQAKSEPRLHVLHRAGKLGLGTATVCELKYAISHDYHVVVTMDADGSHDPKHLPALLGAIGTCSTAGPNVVIGSRYIAGGGIEGWPWYRLVMSRMVNGLARLLLGLAVRDCSGAYRAMCVDFLRGVDLDKITSRGYSFFEEVLWHFKLAGARFEEVPIVFVNRIRGSSKISAAESVRSVGVLVRLGMRNWFRGSISK